MSSARRPVCLMMTAVEPSADALGAGLARALRRRFPGGLRLVGIGGAALAKEGLVSTTDPQSLAVVGAFNALAAYPQVLREARRLAELARVERPDAAILIDAWGFSLRVARALRRSSPSLPIIKYVAPQVWASRPGRAKTLARSVDHLLALHAFDAPLFEAEGLPTTVVGNPATSRDFATCNPDDYRRGLGLAPDEPLLLLLPGSRRGECDRLLPIFEKTVDRLRSARPRLRVALALAESVAAQVAPKVSTWAVPPILVQGEGPRREAMRAATVALACSGTVTTELALAGCPMVVVYRLDPVTFEIARRLVTTPYITLLNVAAGRLIVPERIQGDCRPDILERDLARLLDDTEARSSLAARQNEAVLRLRGDVEFPFDAAADAVARILRTRSPDADFHSG